MKFVSRVVIMKMHGSAVVEGGASNRESKESSGRDLIAKVGSVVVEGERGSEEE